MSSLNRFDGTAVWQGLSPRHQAEIGSIALELVATWWLQEQAADPYDGSDPLLRAAEAADRHLMDELREAFVAAVPLDALTDGEERPLLPSRIGQVCRRCGCSQNDACPGGCGWAEEDLCTACKEPTR